MTLPALVPALVWCADCDGPRGLTVRGTCETCSSASVMREPDATRLFRRDRLDRPHVWPGGLYRGQRFRGEA
jgi:hypothetical protein